MWGQSALSLEKMHSQRDFPPQLFCVFLHQIADYVKEIPTDKNVYVVCQHGVRSKVAIEYLEKEYNFTNLINVEGGMLG